MDEERLEDCKEEEQEENRESGGKGGSEIRREAKGG